MLSGIKAVIFDLDGTVVDSMWMWKAIDIEYLGRYGIPLPDGLQKRLSGMSFTEVANLFQKELHIPETIENIKNAWNQMAMDKYRHEIKTKPGVVHFLQKLREKGIRTGIATSNSKELAMAALQGQKLSEYFDEVHTACEVAHGKPSPDLYLYVAECLRVTPSECLVFEDLSEGLLAAKAAGMRTCGIEDPFSAEYREEKKKLADYYIESYDEIID